MLRATTACENGEAIVLFSFGSALSSHYASARTRSISIPDSRCMLEGSQLGFLWFLRVYDRNRRALRFAFWFLGFAGPERACAVMTLTLDVILFTNGG